MFGNLLFRVTISGESLWPEIVSKKTYWASKLICPRMGRYVIFKNNHTVVVKKILKIEHDQLHLGGTVSWSSSYIIKKTQVIGTLFIKP